MKTAYELDVENRALRALVEYGKIYVNYWSRDCDGCESYGHSIFDTLEEYLEAMESFGMDLEGPGRFTITSPDNLNEPWSGGQWGN